MQRRIDSRESFRNDTLADNHSRLCDMAWRGNRIRCRIVDADGYLSLSEISDSNRRVLFVRLYDDDTISALQPDGWFDLKVNIVEAKVNKQYNMNVKQTCMWNICDCVVLHGIVTNATQILFIPLSASRKLWDNERMYIVSEWLVGTM